MNLAITPSDTYAPPNQDINHELWRILTHRCYHNEEENYYSISAPEAVVRKHRITVNIR